jgi:predicted TIM-barrel fold metal-dependent hydrolase
MASKIAQDVEADAPLQVIDFHNHFVGPSFRTTTQDRIKNPAARVAWARIDALLESPDALLASFDETGVAARVITIPTAYLEDAVGNAPPDTHRCINDEVAMMVAKNPDRIHGLATIDAFSGDDGGRRGSGSAPESSGSRNKSGMTPCL